MTTAALAAPSPVCVVCGEDDVLSTVFLCELCHQANMLRNSGPLDDSQAEYLAALTAEGR